MATFRNDSTTNQFCVNNTSGGKTVVGIGETVQSFDALDRLFDAFVKTADTPFLDEVMRFIELSFSGVETKTITLTDDEVLNARKLVLVAGTAGFTATVRFNSSSAQNPIRRKLDVDRGFISSEMKLNKKVETVYITSTANGTMQVYIERDER